MARPAGVSGVELRFGEAAERGVSEDAVLFGGGEVNEAGEEARSFHERKNEATPENLRALLRGLARWCDDLGYQTAAATIRGHYVEVMAGYGFDTEERRAVYVIKATGRELVKIGFAKHLRDRLATLQTSSPDELQMIAAIPGGLKLEMMLHAAFAEYRVRGEWFRYAAPIVRLVEASLLPPASWGDPDDDGADEWDGIHRGTLEEFTEDLCRRHGLELPSGWATSDQVGDAQ
jgi:hypothetical protein